MTSVAVDSVLRPTTAKTTRIVTLDAIRAVAIVSMVIGHVANYSFLWRTSHAAYYVWDGAQLFMVVSGIVVGIVHHRIVARHGMRTSAVKLAKRAGLLYLVHLSLVGLGLVLAYGWVSEWSADFRPPGLATWSEAVPWALVLMVNPIYINFLGTYVVLLLVAIPAVWLLKRRRTGLLALLVVALYIAGLLWPEAFTLRNGPGQFAGFNNATWGVLFLTGLIVGWHWHRGHVPSVLRSTWVRWVVWVSVAVMAVAVVIDASPWEPGAMVDWLFDKDLMSPGRLLASWVGFVLLYWLATWLEARRWGLALVEPAAVLGGRALDAVVILTVASILLPSLIQQPSSSRLSQVLALVVLGLCWAWAYARHAWRHRADAPGPHRFRAR